MNSVKTLFRYCRVAVALAALTPVCQYASAQMGTLFNYYQKLSSSFVNQVYQDRQGMIWVSTNNGLNSYDGYAFRTYAYDDSLTNYNVNCVMEAADNILYIGTARGLYYKDGDEIGMMRDAASELRIQSFVTKFCLGPDGKMYVGTSGAGLKRVIDKDQTLDLLTEKIDLMRYCRDMAFDKDGILWYVSNSKGVFTISNVCSNDGKKIRISKVYQPKSSSGYALVCCDNANNIYLGYLDGGIYKLDRTTNEFHLIPSTRGLPVSALTVKDDGHLYIGTDGSGLFTMDTGTFQIMQSDIHSRDINLKHSKVYSIFLDRNQNLWLGLLQKGVLMLPPRRNDFKYLGSNLGAENIIGENCLNAVFRQRDGTLWVATDRDGLFNITTGRHFAPNMQSETSVPPTVLTMTEDARGRLWVGSFTNGCGWIDASTGVYHRAQFSYDKAQSVFDIRTDRNGRIWIGTLGDGVKCLDPETGTLREYLSQPDKKNCLYNNYVMQMEMTPDGKWLFVGTPIGLSCIDIETDSWRKVIKGTCLLPGKSINTICYDERMGLFVGTNDGMYHFKVTNQGISEAQGAEGERFTTSDGLLSNEVAAIEIDANKKLWISSDKGLCCYDVKTKKADYFFAADGLQGNEYSAGVSFMDADGMIYFGGTTGLSFFDPLKIKQCKRDLKVSLVQMMVGGAIVKVGMKSGRFTVCDSVVSKAQRFDLCHSDNTITLSFSALTYSSNERISYSYSINGSEWITLPAGENKVTLSGMSPGDYDVQVVAIENGIKSPVKEFTIVIHNPWYFTPFARFIYFLVILLTALWLIRNARERNQQRLDLQAHIHSEELNEQKLTSFINISHEIRTPMTLVVTPLLQLMKEDDDTHRHAIYEVMRRNAERILGLVNQILDIRKIDKGQMVMQMRETDLVGFVGDEVQMFRIQADNKQIKMTYEHDIEALPVWIDKGQFDKVVLNLLSNAVKYTRAGGDVRITVTERDNMAVLTVFDNGEQIPEEALEHIFERFYQLPSLSNQQATGTGVGLDLTRSLVLLHHGGIVARNVADGVEFVVTIPLGKDHLRPEEIAQWTDDEQVNLVVADEQEADELPETEEKEVPNQKKGARPTIVIVEDDDEISHYLMNELSSSYRTLSFPDGEDALPVILRDRPQLVISDVMMPRMDGETLCSKVKNNVNTNDIPFILLTAKTRDEDKLQGLEVGADLYVTKPFNMDILRRNIANLLHSRKLLKNKMKGNEDGNDKIDEVELQSIDERLLNRIMTVINNNLSNSDLNIDMICSEVGISRVHLHRKMKELTNQTPHDFIRNLRLKQAARLLSKKGQSISEVMYRCGFNSATSFSTMFKKMYGVSPREYIKQQQE